jgi:hypothetical protein
MHNPPIMASSSSASNWECRACTYSNKGGKYCTITMCTTPRLKCQAVLAMLASDVAAPTAVVAATAVVAKAILSAPMPRAVFDMPTLVSKKATVSKESVSVPAPVAIVSALAPVAKAKAPDENAHGTSHLPGFVVEIFEMNMGGQGHSCEEHINNCSNVMADNMVMHLCKMQIIVEGWEEMAIATYWVSDGSNYCHVGFLPCHMVRHDVHYDRAVAQVTPVLSPDPMRCNSAECRMFHKNKGCCLAAIIA